MEVEGETEADLSVSEDSCETWKNLLEEPKGRYLLTSKNGSIICEELVQYGMLEDKTTEMNNQEIETITDRIELEAREVESTEMDTTEVQTTKVNRKYI